MELRVLNTNFEAVDILDVFESVIWTDRYKICGDFEIYTPYDSKILSICKHDYYLTCKESKRTMIIEDIQKNTDIENGNHLTITGKSLESILDRRIVWFPTIITGSVQDGIQKILNENVIAPTDSGRTIHNFIFKKSTDIAITSLTITSAQYNGDSVYTVIVNLCTTYNIGFKVTLNDQNQFVFELFAGVDHSYSQITNPYIIFSPNFDNLSNTNFIESKKNLKNTTLIGGETIDNVQKATVIGDGSTDLNRREIYTDASDISSTVDKVTMSEAEYIAQLQRRGLENLSEYKITKVFDGQVDASLMFSDGADSFLGDIVQIVDENGIESRSRIEEIIHSQNKEGYSTYPTFTILEED